MIGSRQYLFLMGTPGIRAGRQKTGNLPGVLLGKN